VFTHNCNVARKKLFVVITDQKLENSKPNRKTNSHDDGNPALFLTLTLSLTLNECC